MIAIIEYLENKNNEKLWEYCQRTVPKYARPGYFIGHLVQSLQEQMMFPLHEFLKDLDKIGNLPNTFCVALKTLTELAQKTTGHS